MNTYIISFTFILAVILISPFKNISNSLFIDSTSIKTIELVLEKEVDKTSDENYLVNSTQIDMCKSENTLPLFQQSFYTFTSLNTLFRPPISA